MSANVPDDWGSYYTICPDCGTRWHASEGCCPCDEAEAEQAEDDEAAFEANYAEDYGDEAEQAEDGGAE